MVCKGDWGGEWEEPEEAVPTQVVLVAILECLSGLRRNERKNRSWWFGQGFQLTDRVVSLCRTCFDQSPATMLLSEGGAELLHALRNRNHDGLGSHRGRERTEPVGTLRRGCGAALLVSRRKSLLDLERVKINLALRASGCF